MGGGSGSDSPGGAGHVGEGPPTNGSWAMTPGADHPAVGRALAIGRLAEIALLVSILFWWTGLRGWAEANPGT